jgi:hypothetical protein
MAWYWWAATAVYLTGSAAFVGLPVYLMSASSTDEHPFLWAVAATLGWPFWLGWQFLKNLL